MTVWEQWCDELKECGGEIVNKKIFLCNCGIHDMECTNVVNGKKCPLFNTPYCCGILRNKEADEYLESEVKDK